VEIGFATNMEWRMEKSNVMRGGRVGKEKVAGFEQMKR